VFFPGSIALCQLETAPGRFLKGASESRFAKRPRLRAAAEARSCVCKAAIRSIGRRQENPYQSALVPGTRQAPRSVNRAGSPPKRYRLWEARALSAPPPHTRMVIRQKESAPVHIADLRVAIEITAGSASPPWCRW